LPKLSHSARFSNHLMARRPSPCRALDNEIVKWQAQALEVLGVLGRRGYRSAAGPRRFRAEPLGSEGE